eukprot:3590829-Amphidinium_carterae.1
MAAIDIFAALPEATSADEVRLLTTMAEVSELSFDQSNVRPSVRFVPRGVSSWSNFDSNFVGSSSIENGRSSSSTPEVLQHRGHATVIGYVLLQMSFDVKDPQVAVQFVELRGNRCYDLIARDSKAFPELRHLQLVNSPCNYVRLRETAGGVYSAEGAVELFPRSHEERLGLRLAHMKNKS